MSEPRMYELELISGVEGQAVYLNQYRIAGPKPWGGGHLVRRWIIGVDDLARAIPELRAALSRVAEEGE